MGPARRFAYLVIGLIFVGLGVLGAILPVLPTTPFLLVSLWAFSKSSARLERWLLEHPRFGPRLVAWRTNRVIPLPVKLTAWGSMIGSLTLMVVTGAPPTAMIGAASVMAIGAVYVATKPSRPPAE
ncbi:MAG: YbaN family protein [Kofleriaceae bacterium]|nr:YbaN family protein [Kofleriaceae bacterium]